MHPSDKAVLLETRRQFFGRGARGLGVAALALGGLAIALAPAGWIVRYSLRVRATALAPSALD